MKLTTYRKNSKGLHDKLKKQMEGLRSNMKETLVRQKSIDSRHELLSDHFKLSRSNLECDKQKAKSVAAQNRIDIFLKREEKYRMLIKSMQEELHNIQEKIKGRDEILKELRLNVPTLREVRVGDFGEVISIPEIDKCHIY